MSELPPHHPTCSRPPGRHPGAEPGKEPGFLEGLLLACSGSAPGQQLCPDQATEAPEGHSHGGRPRERGLRYVPRCQLCPGSFLWKAQRWRMGPQGVPRPHGCWAGAHSHGAPPSSGRPGSHPRARSHSCSSSLWGWGMELRGKRRAAPTLRGDARA